MKRLIAVISLLFLFSCAQKIIDVKSPCVSKNDGPCGPKRPVNDWWLKNTNYKEKV